ncbi:hypothetical protein MRB53_037762 [Persea americana]|nr:hypothetical protein MRB53_037762 [Persea americana]
MSILTEVDFARLSTDASENFVDAYYNALNGTRKEISSFYVPATVLPSGRGLPHLSINGEVLNDAAKLQEVFENQMPWTHYEAQSVDVHVMNPSMVNITSKSKKDHERNVSLVVQVSGYVRYHERKDGPMRGFSDNFVLVPNTEQVGGRCRRLIADTTVDCKDFSRKNDTIEVETIDVSTVLHARFDLTVDGAFVGCRFVEAEKYGNQKKHNNRRIDFKTISTGQRKTRPDLVVANGVMDVEMAVKAVRKLDERMYTGSGRSYGVGTIVVYIWTEHELTAGCEPSEFDFPSGNLDNWIAGDYEVIDSGLEPKHCITMRNVNPNVVKQKANKFIAQRTDNRYGQQPFAKLVFHYRTKEDLLQAGCMPQPAKAWPVPEEQKEPSVIMSSEEDEVEDDDADHNDELALPYDRSPNTPDVSASSEDGNGHQEFTGDGHESTPALPPVDPATSIKRVTIDGQTVDVPSVQETLSFIPDEGIRTQILFRIFLENVGPDLREITERAIVQHIRPWARIYIDPNGTQFFYLNPVLDHMLANQARRDRQDGRQQDHGSANKRKRIDYPPRN